jgi:hypothetical protein
MQNSCPCLFAAGTSDIERRSKKAENPKQEAGVFQIFAVL